MGRMARPSGGLAGQDRGRAKFCRWLRWAGLYRGIADGALGFWKALEEVWPKTRGQRCWVHKTANVLTKLPNSQHARAKRALEEIWMADTKKDALVAFDAFVEIYAIKYEKAVECLTCLPSGSSSARICL